MDASTMKAIEKSSNLPSTPEAAMAADDIKAPSKKKIVIKPKVKAGSKVAHKVKKEEPAAPKKPAHKIAHKVKKTDDLPPEVKVRDDSLQTISFIPEPAKRDKSDDADPVPPSDSNAGVSEQVSELATDPKADAQADEIIE